MLHVARRGCLMWCSTTSCIISVVGTSTMIYRRGFEEWYVGAMVRDERCINHGLYLVWVYAVGMLVGGDYI